MQHAIAGVHLDVAVVPLDRHREGSDEERFGIDELANRVGVEIPSIEPAVDGSGLSIALGSREVPTLEMAAGYGVFANSGNVSSLRMTPSRTRPQ